MSRTPILDLPHPVRAVSVAGDDGPDPPALHLAILAVSALVEEAELTPKPALVDREGNGAHHDLDLKRLRRSARALQGGFDAIARTAAGGVGARRLREQIGAIGRDMERRMMAATGGSNAHRGAIWALGLLAAAAARPRTGRRAEDIARAASALARLPDRLAPARPASHGELARIAFGAAGARGEARAGFPHALRVGLPELRSARGRGVPEDRARLDALMAIMARLDDTCLLHRGGRAALALAQQGARAVLDAGGTATPSGLERLQRLHTGLMALWASPGGSADLLAVTLFLDRLEAEGGPPPSVEPARGGNPWKR